MRASLALVFCFAAMSCKFASDQAVVGENGVAYSVNKHGATNLDLYDGAEGGASSAPVAIGSGNGSAAHVAATATSMIGKENCSDDPAKKIKCAQQASDILRSAGVKIQGSWAVNGLVSQLRALGWRETRGPCPPGSVQHTAGKESKGRHIGVVGTDGNAVHNSSSLGSSPVCGRLTNRPYDSWKRRATCLVSPN